MSNPLRWPLHYQILFAMVVGAAVGLVVNPGEQELSDARFVVAAENDGLQLKLLPAGAGEPIYSERFKDVAALKKRFPELAKRFSDKKGTNSIEVKVTGRRVHLSEDGKTITLRYIREHDGKRVITNFDAATIEKLLTDHPEWEAQKETAIDWYAGHSVRKFSVWSKFVGDLFLRLLKMITIPLIVTSLIVGVAGLGQTGRLGSMFSKTMLYYLATSLLAITTGIALVNIIRPGVGAELPGGGGGAIAGGGQSLSSIFVNLVNSMIPTNPVHSLANGEFLSIITFSILFGVFIIKVGGSSGERMRGFFQAAFDVMMDMTQAVIRLAPIGVLAFMLFATATQGIEVFKMFAWYMLTVFLALVVHATIILPIILWVVARQSPLAYAKAMAPALLTAFSTASSNGTLPLTLNCVEERAGIPNRVSSFVLPLGATINMDGTALYEAVAVLFIAQATANFELTLQTQIIVAMTALLASVGAAGIPSAGLVMMVIVLDAVGLKADAVGLIIAVDRVLDMCRTSVNVWSDSCGCAVVSRFEPDEPVETTPPEQSAPGSA